MQWGRHLMGIMLAIAASPAANFLLEKLPKPHTRVVSIMAISCQVPSLLSMYPIRGSPAEG
jgi:hypothetical protein